MTREYKLDDLTLTVHDDDTIEVQRIYKPLLGPQPTPDPPPPEPPSEYRLVYTFDPDTPEDRWLTLDGAQIPEDTQVWIRALPSETGIHPVDFYFNGDDYRRENQLPYDFEGGGPSSFSSGPAEVMADYGTGQTATATFTVISDPIGDDPPPDEPDDELPVPEGELAEVTLQDRIESNGHVFELDGEEQVGRFVTGSPFVLLPPGGKAHIHFEAHVEAGGSGAMLSPPWGDHQGYNDYRRYKANLSHWSGTPVGGNNVICVVDETKLGDGPGHVVAPGGDEAHERPAVKNLRMLTVVDYHPKANEFRPPYGRPDNGRFFFDEGVATSQIYRLPELDMPGLDVEETLARIHPYGDIIDHVTMWAKRYFSAGIHTYGREQSAYMGDLAMLLMHPGATRKVKLHAAKILCQIGIDYWGQCMNGGEYGIYKGGIGTFTKLPILVAGYLLQDERLMDPWHPTEGHFTRKACITSYQVIPDESGKPVWRENGSLSKPSNDAYRVCCTANGWASGALFCSLVPEIRAAFHHDDFFTYMGRHVASYPVGASQRIHSEWLQPLWETHWKG